MADRPSSVDRLPEPIQELIGKLRIQGRSIDEIVAHLKTLDIEISRSAMGRHVRSLAAMRERLQNSRQLATALVERFGAESDNKVARLNLEILHGLILQVATATKEGEDGEPEPVTFDAQSVMFLSSALQKLASAEKTDADLRIRLREQVAKEAASAVEKVGKSAGLTADTVATIREAILGVA